MLSNKILRYTTIYGRRAAVSSFSSSSSTTALLRRRLSTITTTVPTAKDGKGSPFLNLALFAAGGLALTGAGVVKVVHDEVGSIEGLKRTLSFYSLAIPAFSQYKMHVFLGSSQETFDELDRARSKQGLDKILELGGFYTKTGQMVASNVGNGFPRIWQETMSILQDQCPSRPFEVVQSIIENDYGKPLNEVFESFDPIPIGAASIGQVHRAKLHSGESVVVKVSYPEVEETFRGDVRTIKLFAKLAQPVHVKVLEEIEKQFMTEFDYTNEAAQMNTVRENLERAGYAGRNKLCIVPKAYTDLCTKRVLVMEEIRGDKLPNALRLDFERYAANAGMTVEEFRAQQEAKLEELGGGGKDINGPTANEFDVYIKMVEAKRKVHNLAAFVHNCTFGLLPSVPKKAYREMALPINHAKLVDDLILIHGHECLVDGYFNGDPHPGNFLMPGLKEGKPQIGLIDYGQVKKLSKEKRLHLCKIVIALANEDKKAIAKLMAEAGFKSKTMNEDVIYKFAKINYDEDNEELTEGKHIQLFLDELEARDPVSSLPDDYIIVGRTSVILRGLAHTLRQSRSIAKAWKPIAEKVLDEEGLIL